MLSIILGSGIVFAVGSLLIKDEYVSQTVLVPSEPNNNGLSNLGGSLGGLAGIAGIDLGSAGSNNLQVAIELLQSRAFLYEFIERYDLAPYLLAYDYYDRDSKEVKFDAELYQHGEWVRQVEPPRSKIPEAWEAYPELRERLSIINDTARGIVTVELTYIAPEIAQRWLRLMIKDINEQMRERERVRVSKSIDYLTAQAEQADYAELKTSLYNLLQEQFQKDMLIAVRDDYVFEIVDPPQLPVYPEGLPWAIWLLIGVIISSLVIFVTMILRSYETLR